jgi:hypothetical protein
MLIWYSDGLIERRGEVVDDGLDRLAALAADLTGTDAQQWCEALLAGMTDGQDVSDDVVVACLHMRGEHNSKPQPLGQERTAVRAVPSPPRTTRPSPSAASPRGPLVGCGLPALVGWPSAEGSRRDVTSVVEGVLGWLDEHRGGG